MANKKKKYISPKRGTDIINEALFGMIVIIEVKDVLAKNNLSKEAQSKVLHTLKDELLKNIFKK